MANTLTGLIPVIYEALDIVAREVAGIIPSVYYDPNMSERVAEGQTLRIPIVGAGSAQNITPGAIPNSGDIILGYADVEVSKSRSVPVRFEGKEQAQLGGQYNNIIRDAFAQAMRTLVNEIETDLASELLTSGYLATGTAGTTPFGSNLSEAGNIAALMEKEGFPKEGRSLIINTAALANLYSLANLTSVNQAGTDEVLKRGELINLFGMSVKASAQITKHTKGTGSDYVLDGDHSAGDTTIAVTTGTGTILAGDVVTIGNYSYVVTSALSDGSFTIGGNGLKEDVSSGESVTLDADSTPCYGIHRNSTVLAMRAPSRPAEGDLAQDVTIVTDPVTGLGFEVAAYPEYRRIYYEVAASWGVKTIREDYVIRLQG